MARLEAAFAETVASRDNERSKKASQRVRLLANPLISVGEIQRTLEDYTRHCKSSHLYSLICPPASLAVVTWQTAPHGAWLSKVAPLLFDVLDFCPNTKLQHSKLSKALYSMHENHSLELQPRMKPQDAMDQISLCIRIVLSMLRQIKLSESHKFRVMRSLGCEEQAKLNMVLKKVVLPVGYMEDQVLNDESEESQECRLQQLDMQPSLALVPFESQPKTKEEEKKPTVGVATSAVPGSFILPLPSIFSKVLNKPAETHNAADQGRASTVSASANKRNLKLKDEDLVSQAMSRVPKEVTAQAKKKPSKKPGQKKTKNKKNKSQTKKKGNAKAPKHSKDAKCEESHKEEATEKTASAPDVPMYHVQEYPALSDTYRNLYVSRHHNRAKALAKQGGLSAEAAKERGRLAAKEASIMWDEARG